MVLSNSYSMICEYRFTDNVGFERSKSKSQLEVPLVCSRLDLDYEAVEPTFYAGSRTNEIHKLLECLACAFIF